MYWPLFGTHFISGRVQWARPMIILGTLRFTNLTTQFDEMINIKWPLCERMSTVLHVIVYMVIHGPESTVDLFVNTGAGSECPQPSSCQMYVLSCHPAPLLDFALHASSLYCYERTKRVPRVSLGLEPMSLLTIVLRCCPKTLSHYRQ